MQIQLETFLPLEILFIPFKLDHLVYPGILPRFYWDSCSSGLLFIINVVTLDFAGYKKISKLYILTNIVNSNVFIVNMNVFKMKPNSQIHVDNIAAEMLVIL